jgi:hypothetical protein
MGRNVAPARWVDTHASPLVLFMYDTKSIHGWAFQLLLVYRNSCSNKLRCILRSCLMLDILHSCSENHLPITNTRTFGFFY